VWAEHRIFKC